MGMESRVLVLAHCLLNKATRWWQEGKPLERNIGLAAEIIEYALRHNIGVIQMPCPEFTFCGNPRPSRTKDEYESLPGFKEHCDRLARSVAEQLKTLTSISVRPRIYVLAIVGVRRSPSCAVRSATRKVCGEVKVVEERGVFMDALERHIAREGLNVEFLEFDFDHPQEAIIGLKRILARE
ncbi:hypothetical protein KEJ29_03105 [Candidatus Bathyarchaeota archaeon]|nr:hypothetical protein [Candidatus Bathyarchaeota archaeon]